MCSTFKTHSNINQSAVMLKDIVTCFVYTDIIFEAKFKQHKNCKWYSEIGTTQVRTILCLQLWEVKERPLWVKQYQQQRDINCRRGIWDSRRVSVVERGGLRVDRSVTNVLKHNSVHDPFRNIHSIMHYLFMYDFRHACTGKCVYLHKYI